MTVRCAIRPAADRDLDELAEYYADEGGEGLLVRFLLAVDGKRDVSGILIHEERE